MSNAGKLVKNLVKAKKESVMGKLGDSPYEDPMEPWSAKYAQPVKEESLNEDSLLMKYIRSLGFNPEFMSFAQRSSYARSNAFKRFKSSHTFDIEKQNIKKEDVNEESEQLDEAGTGLLMSFIKSKGLNPLTMDGNQKKAYARSSEFKIFKMRHVKEVSGMGERGDDWNEEKKKEVQESLSGYNKHKIRVKVSKDGGEKHHVDMKVFANSEAEAKGVARLQLKKKGYETHSATHQGLDYSWLKKEEVEQIEELSTDLLGRYKKAAGAQASAADKAGDVAKGNKRFSGIMKATRKQFDNDDKKINELKNMPDNMDADDHITREDLRKWFSKTDPQGDWKRINSKGEVAGPCAREPGEPKPKCMSKEKRSELSKSERAAAVATKRRHDPVADRAGKGGKPINVSNYGKGKLSEESDAVESLETSLRNPSSYDAIDQMMQTISKKSGISPKELHDNFVKKHGKTPDDYAKGVMEAEIDEACWDTHKQVGTKMKGGKVVPNCVPKNEETEQIDEKNKPTNPSLWSRAKSLARSKFDVYPSAYANGWASKWYKSKGGGWKSVSEDTVQEGIGGIEDSPLSATNSVKAMESEHRKKNMKSARIIKAIYKKKGKSESTYDWEKDDKPNAKVTLQGGTTMTGKPRDTVEIEPVLKTRPNSQKQ